jgi:hypothetical protein
MLAISLATDGFSATLSTFIDHPHAADSRAFARRGKSACADSRARQNELPEIRF